MTLWPFRRFVRRANGETMASRDAPEPPAGLLDRTFAGLAMAHLQTPTPEAETTERTSPAPAGDVIPFPTPDAPRRPDAPARRAPTSRERI